MSRLLVFLLGITTLFLPAIAGATSGVFVREVNWAGSASSAADEWLELGNTGTSDVDLAGWSLWNTAGEAKEQVRIERGLLPAGGSYLIANNGPDYSFSGGISTLSVVPDLVASGLSLSNSALKLELRNAVGAVVDVVGNGGKPFAGSTDPIVSMERVLEPFVAGGEAAGWRAASTTSGLDPANKQLGTPTPSGRVLPVVTPTEAAAEIPPPPPLVSIEAVARKTVDGTVRIRGQITVPEAFYKARTVIVAEGDWSIELSLPDPLPQELGRGDRVEVTGKVSTGSTPKLLAQEPSDIVVAEAGIAWSPLILTAKQVRMFQIVRLTGKATPVRGSVEVRVASRTVKVTRRQGISFPPIEDGDTVTMTGLVVTEEPLTVRVLEDSAVSVMASDEAAEPVAPTSATSQSEARGDDVAGEGDEDAVEAMPLSDLSEALASGGRQLEATGSAAGQDQPASVVLGAQDIRMTDPLARGSALVALISLCAILLLLGDWIWMYLKARQLQ